MLIQAVMEAEIATKTGASFGERSAERITYRNGYRARPSGEPSAFPLRPLYRVMKNG